MDVDALGERAAVAVAQLRVDDAGGFISYTGADQAWAEWTGTQDVGALEEQAVALLRRTVGPGLIAMLLC